jgi:hypothetical protein
MMAVSLKRQRKASPNRRGDGRRISAVTAANKKFSRLRIFERSPQIKAA